MCFGVTWSPAADASVDVLCTLSDSLIIAVLQHFQQELRSPAAERFLTLSAAVFITSSLTVSTAVFIQPYASMGGYLVYCAFVCLSFCFFCTVKDFSAAEKGRGVKFCLPVGLLSGQVLSNFGGQRSPGTKNARLALPR